MSIAGKREALRKMGRQSRSLRHKAMRLADRGLVFSAAQVTETALQVERVAAQVRLALLAIEDDADAEVSNA